MTPVEAQFAEAIAAEHFGVVASVRVLPGEFDQNFALTTASGEGYILKFSHPQTPDSQLDFENALKAHLAHLPVPRLVLSRKGEAVVKTAGGLRVRLLTRLPGRMLVDICPRPGALAAEIGNLLGRVDRALAEFSHPAMHRDWLWDLTGAPAVIRANLDAVLPADLPAVTHFLDRFERFAAPLFGDLPAHVIHNDANDHNLLVQANGRLSGLVDFGDSLFAPRVCEPAIAAAYILLGEPEPALPAAALVGGYHAVNPLLADELEIFWELVGARLAMSIAIAAGRARQDTGNVYHQVTSQPASAALRKLAALDRTVLIAALRSALP